MRRNVFAGSVLVAVLAVMTAAMAAEVEMQRGERDDRQEILDHIHGIFRAFLAKDRETIRRTHTEDWVGFLGPSTTIERGIEDYMRGAERSLESFHGTGYELLDTEVQIHGDLGIVFYVARYDYRDEAGQEHSLGLRSVDLYRRVDGRWIQFGSHITPIPEGGAWGEGDGGE